MQAGGAERTRNNAQINPKTLFALHALAMHSLARALLSDWFVFVFSVVALAIL